MNHKKATEALGAQLGHTPYSIEDIYTAIQCEKGEVLQEVKSVWAWWKKEGDKQAIDKQKLKMELADVLHFTCLAFQKYHSIVFMQDYLEATLDLPIISEPLVNAPFAILHFTATTELPLHKRLNIAKIIDCLFSFALTFGISVQDLIEAYFEKGRINVERWKKVHNADLI
jgi:dimeric dUTPase (all-alpha-NTP-PPase superfamily)